MKSVIKKEIRPHSFAAWMAFMRPKTFWIAAALVCVGTAFAGALAGTWNLWIFLFTLIGLAVWSWRQNLSLIPLLGLVCCLYMMAELSVWNWIYFTIWLIIGLIIYFSFSYKNSKLN